MKRDYGSVKLSGMMLILGIAALVLRKMLYAQAVDARGLLLQNHPLEIALAALTAAALTVLVLAVRKQKGSGNFADCYVADLPAAFGNVAAGAGIAITVLTGAPGMGGYLESAWRILGLAAPVCFCVAAFARMWGKTPFFLLHVVGCLFFVVHIVSRYQLWSGNPQMQDYVFSLLGAMTLMFFGFYTAALEAGCGSRRMSLGMGLAAVYLCLAELARSSCPALYLGGACWVLTELCSMKTSSEADS